MNDSFEIGITRDSVWVVVSDEILADGSADAMACRAFINLKDAQDYKRTLQKMYEEDEADVNFTIQNCLLIKEVV